MIRCNTTNDTILITPNSADGLTFNYDGPASFHKSVTGVTAATTSNDTTLATTEFVKTAVASGGGGGGSATLASYSNEMAAYYNGVNEGSQYISSGNGLVWAVNSKYKPIFTFNQNVLGVQSTGCALTINASPSSAYSSMVGQTAWTIECWVYPTAWSAGNENYIFDPRGNGDNTGMAFGFYQPTGQTYARPHVFSGGTSASFNGGGSATKVTTSGPTDMVLNTWNHCCWVKRATDNNNIYIYLNGYSCGTVLCGTNAYSTADWSRVSIGKLYNYTTFPFVGKLDGLRVSNTALYTFNFVPPSIFTSTSSTVFLLGSPDGDAAIDKVSGLTLNRDATAGSIETINVAFASRTINNYASNADALAAGLPLNSMYRQGNFLKFVIPSTFQKWAGSGTTNFNTTSSHFNLLGRGSIMPFNDQIFNTSLYLRDSSYQFSYAAEFRLVRPGIYTDSDLSTAGVGNNGAFFPLLHLYYNNTNSSFWIDQEYSSKSYIKGAGNTQVFNWFDVSALVGNNLTWFADNTTYYILFNFSAAQTTIRLSKVKSNAQATGTTNGWNFSTYPVNIQSVNVGGSPLPSPPFYFT